MNAPLILLVLWSIGASFLVLAGLIFLPSRVVGLLGVLLIATHGLADGVLPGSASPPAAQAAGACCSGPASCRCPSA